MERQEYYDYAEEGGQQRCPRALLYPSSYTHPTPGTTPTLFNTPYSTLSFPHYAPPLFNNDPASMPEYPHQPPPLPLPLPPSSLTLYPGSYSSANSPASAPDIDYVQELDLEMVQCFYPEAIHSPTGTTSPRTSVPPGTIPPAAHVQQQQQQQQQQQPSSAASTSSVAATDVIIFQCDHPGCKRSYRRLCDLRKHKKRHQKPFPCRHAAAKGCKSFFSTEKDRDRHERSKHRREEHLACIVCGHRTARKDNMKDHVRRRHSEKDLDEIMAMIVTNNVPGASSSSS